MEERKTFTFNGVNSADYGLYISGDSVYNAPSRVYDMVDIAGRNGQLAIDQGRFENIEVTYPAFIFAETQTEFAQRLREIRAWLMSPVGYQRLEDTYHPDEFRMAIYMSGLEADPTHYNEAGEFELTFNCKPQRFLKSGEEEIVLGEWGETETITGDIATFEAESNTGIKSLVVDIDPVQSGSGDPSPDNVRPISGWDEVEVNHSGKNILKLPTWEEVTALPRVGNYSSMAIKCKPNTDYYLSSRVINDYVPSGLYIYVLITNNPNAESPFLSIVHHYDGIRNGVIRSTTDGYLWLRISQTIESKWNRILESIETQLEEGTTPTSYQPFGQSYYIPFKDSQDNPITVYGGEIDVVSGKLTITKTKVSIPNTMAWYSNHPHLFYTANFGVSPSDGEIPSTYGCGSRSACDRYKPIDGFGSSIGDKQCAVNTTSISSNGNNITIHDEDYETKEEFLASFSTIELVYPLHTPIEIDLTPTEINTLDGVNNILADSGEVSVEYGDDPNILVNPTPFEALPLIEVVGVGSLTVGNITVTITGDSTQDIFIDSDIMEAYEDDNGAIISRNDRINLSGTDFPKLGEETRVESNGLTSVKITPRWWTI